MFGFPLDLSDLRQAEGEPAAPIMIWPNREGIDSVLIPNDFTATNDRARSATFLLIGSRTWSKTFLTILCITMA